MKAIELINRFEGWAPKEIAWQRDNTGLQVGDLSRPVTNVLLCLEATEEVIDEAIAKNCNLIFTHHPFLFHPLKQINLIDENSRIIEKLIKNDISLYSAHTNLDFTKDGVSFTLAKTLGLTKIKFLSNLKSNQYKLSVFVPEEKLEEVSAAIFENGGGIIGEYSHCSFRSAGVGSFKGSEKSNPQKGEKEKLETVNEIKLETLVDTWKINKVLAALKKAHPYEEPAYDVYLIDNVNVNYGIGAIGEFDKALDKEEFLDLVSEKLKASNFRYSGGTGKVKKVAVCGGSGIDYLPNAINSKADAYITGDIKYHSFFDALGKILLIDAGHYETEIHSLNEVKNKFEDILKNQNSHVYKFSKTTNPILFYKN